MSFDIQLSDLTNSTTSTDGTGVFDVLVQATVRHIESQYNEGRLAGTDYANVYLGSIQSVLAESVRFALQEKQSGEQAALIAEQVKSEVKNNELGGILDQQKRKLQEEIDLIIAQTANQYEQVAFSQADTSRRNLLNAQEVIKTEKETALIVRQESELSQNGVVDRALTVERTVATTSGALDNTNKTNAEVALLNAQELKVDAEKLLVDAQELKVDAEKLLVSAQAAEIGPNAAVERDKITADKLLVEAQTVEVSPNATSQRAKIDSEKLLVDAQAAEIGPNATSQRDKISSEKLLLDAQTAEVSPNALAERSKISSEKLLVDAQTAEVGLNGTSQRAKMSAETTLLNSRNTEQIAATTRLDSESAQRVLLMQAQTTGFKTDAKLKLLRQLYEGYAVNVTTLGEVTAAPTSATSASLDAVANDILGSLN